MLKLIKSLMFIAAISQSIQLFAADVASPSKAKSEVKTAVEDSDDAIASRLKSLHKELGGLSDELNKNAGARTESAQKHLKAEMNDLEKRLTGLDKEVRDLVSMQATDLKAQVRETIGGALTSTAGLFKKLGDDLHK